MEPVGSVHYLYGDPWLDKKGLAKELGCSVSFIEKRTREGLPSRLFAGRRQYRLRSAESWLREHGHLVEDAGA